jgi:hypothetical protein
MAKWSKDDIDQAWHFLEPFRKHSLHSEYLSTSRSGASRIRFLSADTDGSICDVTWAVARITGCRYNNDYGCIVASFMNMRQDFAIISNFNYSAASHDLNEKGYSLSWNTPEGKAALGLTADDDIYDGYFFDTNRL